MSCRSFFILLLLFIMLTALCFSFGAVTSFAETLDVLSDLEVDPSFNSANYPTRSGDHSLSLITLAEGSDKFLYAYVYQPNGDNLAKDIRLAVGNDSSTLQYDDYSLTLISNQSVFFKYKINNLTVSSGRTRIYSIVQLARSFNSAWDSALEYNQTASTVPYQVGKQFKFTEVNGNTELSCTDLVTIDISDKFVGFVRYVKNSQGLFNIKYAGTDRFFVAFNTDVEIDHIVSIRLGYEREGVTEWSKLSSSMSDEILHDSIIDTITESDSYSSSYDFLWVSWDYSWDKIQSGTEFLSTVEQSSINESHFVDVGYNTSLSEEGRSALQNKEWIISFYDSDYCEYCQDYSGVSFPPFFSRVGDVTIFQISYITDGVCYNLGAVDNKQTGSSDPVSETITQLSVDGHIFDIPSLDGISDYIKLALKVIAIVILIIILLPILPYLLKLIVFIISIPFKIFKALFSRKPKAKDSQ